MKQNLMWFQIDGKLIIFSCHHLRHRILESLWLEKILKITKPIGKHESQAQTGEFRESCWGAEAFGLRSWIKNCGVTVRGGRGLSQGDTAAQTPSQLGNLHCPEEIDRSSSFLHGVPCTLHLHLMGQGWMVTKASALMPNHGRTSKCSHFSRRALIPFSKSTSLATELWWKNFQSLDSKLCFSIQLQEKE